MDDFALALSDVAAGWRAMRPPARMTVSQCAVKNLKVSRPGGGAGDYQLQETAYMAEPGDTLASRRYSGVVFIGGAQSGKTFMLIEGMLTYAVCVDAGDTLIVQMTQDKAREYSKQRIDRAIRASPALWEMRSSARRDDNLHDKQFKNGMWVRLAWPTVSNFSSSSYRYVLGTDYDRWPDNIDNEGDGWTLMGKRIATFGSRGMQCIETSPGRDIKIADFEPTTPHEAPPVGGGLGIYNTSDRRRWYWQCPHCREHFEAAPGLGLFNLPSDDELIESVRDMDIGTFARQHAAIPCPACSAVLTPADKDGLNRNGIWLPDGVQIDVHRRMSGNPRQARTAGFWLGGVAATYVSWQALIHKHLDALQHYALTGEETLLRSTANTDQAVPYMPRHLVEARRGQKAAGSAQVDTPRYIVPPWARFLVQSVDVQGGANARFVVQVHAVGAQRQQALIDRYAVRESERAEGEDRFAPINPSSFPEDWDVLTKRAAATYRTEDGREMRVRLTLIDSGGEDGVTANAYAWFRRLRRIPGGLHRRVRLTKGHTAKGTVTRNEWTFRETMVGGEHGNGDVPLWLLETNKLKDMVDAGLRRGEDGHGRYYFPAPKGPRNPAGWLPQSFFDELRAEIRNEKGGWDQVKVRNESFDLCVMITAGVAMLGCDRKGWWESPPTWALPLDQNTDVIEPEERRAEKIEVAQAVASEGFRKVHVSPYLQGR